MQLDAAHLGTEPPLSANEISHILWRGRSVILVCLVLGAVCGTILTRMQTPAYVAEAVVIVRPPVVPAEGQAAADIPPAWLSATARDVMTSRSMIERALRDAQVALPPPTPGLIGNVISSLRSLAGGGVDQDLAPAEGEADELTAVQSGLAVTANAGSFAIVVRQTSPSPVFSADFANALVNAYTLKQVEDLAARNAERLATLFERRDDVARSIEEAAQTALALSRQPNTEVVLELQRQRLDELQRVATSLATQIEQLGVLAPDPNIWFVSPAVVPVQRTFTMPMITLSTSILLPTLLAAAFLILGAQFRRSVARRLTAENTAPDEQPTA